MKLSLLKKLIPINHPLRTLYHRAWGIVAAVRYCFPGKKIEYIGVTGTDGKTTSVFLISQLLAMLGKKVGMSSTVGFRIGDHYWTNKSHKTSMGRFGLQALLDRFVREKCDIGIIECSSHGLEQGRLTGIDFSTALITNLSREHLDYHLTMDAYKKAKGLLFKKMQRSTHRRVSVVFDSFEESAYFQSFTTDVKITYGSKKDSVLRLIDSTPLTKGQTIRFAYQEQEYTVVSLLDGKFNAFNILGALGVLLGRGVHIDQLLPLIPQLTSVPGRMKEITDSTSPYRFFIDYAVTPEALKILYGSLRPLGKRLIAILGACGDRDQGKRPAMGKIAAEMCDMVYFTDEEPYTEDPNVIIEMLTSGALLVPESRFEVVPDRRDAIVAALKDAKENDVIVITGMGDQTSRIVGEKKEAWSDREEVLRAIQKL